jgi:hypothetical protein
MGEGHPQNVGWPHPQPLILRMLHPRALPSPINLTRITKCLNYLILILMYHNYNTHMYIFLLFLFIFVKIGRNFMDIYFHKNLSNMQSDYSILPKLHVLIIMMVQLFHTSRIE